MRVMLTILNFEMTEEVRLQNPGVNQITSYKHPASQHNSLIQIHAHDLPEPGPGTKTPNSWHWR
jgi:hypothetical protein